VKQASDFSNHHSPITNLEYRSAISLSFNPGNIDRDIAKGCWELVIGEW
jgi:hypothetical protein